jgi:8-oxo-dGTP pyrophosphatase MutT (NUDIX family)
MAKEAKPDWHVLAEKQVYHNPPWLSVREQQVRLPNGHVIDDYVLAKGPDVAMVFAVTTTRQVLFVEQYKHGVKETIWDLPAGYIDAGEDPLVAARRELEEETGYIGERWYPLHQLYADTNRSNNTYHFYLALEVKPTGVRHLDETENIRVHQVPLAEIHSVFTADKIAATGSALGIYAGLHYLAGLSFDKPAQSTD